MSIFMQKIIISIRWSHIKAVAAVYIRCIHSIYLFDWYQRNPTRTRYTRQLKYVPILVFLNCFAMSLYIYVCWSMVGLSVRNEVIYRKNCHHTHLVLRLRADCSKICFIIIVGGPIENTPHLQTTQTHIQRHTNTRRAQAYNKWGYVRRTPANVIQLNSQRRNC